MKIVLPLFPSYLFVYINKRAGKGSSVSRRAAFRRQRQAVCSSSTPRDQVLRSGVSGQWIEPYREFVVGESSYKKWRHARNLRHPGEKRQQLALRADTGIDSPACRRRGRCRESGAARLSAKSSRERTMPQATRLLSSKFRLKLQRIRYGVVFFLVYGSLTAFCVLLFLLLRPVELLNSSVQTRR